MASIQLLRQQRFAFLKRVYEVTGGSRTKHVSMWDVGKAVGLSTEEIRGAWEFLSGEGLVATTTYGGGIRITHQGVVEIENALANPDQDTHYFPAVNIINVHNISQSQIQQGTTTSSQVTTYLIDSKKVADFISKLKGSLSELSLQEEQRLEVDAEIATVDAQLSSPHPKQSILMESLQSLRRILESTATNLLAQQLISQLSAMDL